MVNKETWSIENKGKPWTDAELSLILSDAPTKVNCERYAKHFKRGLGSIAQIYQWSMTSKKEIKRKKGEDKFINQVKRVSKEVGWV
jgi:hypothetical protein